MLIVSGRLPSRWQFTRPNSHLSTTPAHLVAFHGHLNWILIFKVFVKWTMTKSIHSNKFIPKSALLQKHVTCKLHIYLTHWLLILTKFLGNAPLSVQQQCIMHDCQQFVGSLQGGKSGERAALPRGSPIIKIEGQTFFFATAEFLYLALQFSRNTSWASFSSKDVLTCGYSLN